MNYLRPLFLAVLISTLIFSSVPYGIWQLIGLAASLVFVTLNYYRTKGTKVPIQKISKLLIIPETRRYSKENGK